MRRAFFVAVNVTREAAWLHVTSGAHTAAGSRSAVG
jgi:hypothetical protein